jgi:DNA-binding HxlR family transcriptional regulator
MDKNRTYGQACPVAHAMDVLGERWALLVVRELRLGPRRYTDLAANLPGIGPNVLAQRLRELERSGVVRRRTLPPPAAAKVYELTPWGAELEPVFAALARWGMRSPQPLQGALGPDSVLLGMRTFFRSTEPWDATVEIRLERDVYVLRVEGGAVAELRRGEAAAPDAALACGVAVLHAVTSGQRSLDDALRAGDLTVDGDAAVVRRLVAAAQRPNSGLGEPAQPPPGGSGKPLSGPARP